MSTVSNSFVHVIAANDQGRDFVCGDIHGQWLQLQAALRRVDFNTEKDRLFALGDLVDRGTQSREVFTLLNEPWFYSIRGNHEQLMFDALEKKLPQDIELWSQQGGNSWLSDPMRLSINEKSLMQLIDQQRELMPWAIELMLADGRRVGLVHAEVPVPDWAAYINQMSSGDSHASQLRYRSIWSRQIRETGYEAGVAGVDLCVHGHCMFQKPIRQFNRCYIDTGAYLTKKRLWGIKKQQLGFLTLMQVEALFDIKEQSIEAIKALSWNRSRHL